MRDIIRLRNHGIRPEFVREMADLGFDPDDIDPLIRLRVHGVDPELIARLQEMGYDDLTIDEAIRLKNHGISSSQVRNSCLVPSPVGCSPRTL